MDLEQTLEEMLSVERFEPPVEFREQVLWSDPKIYEEAAAPRPIPAGCRRRGTGYRSASDSRMPPL